ncbi:ABC transporter ATP-binding protein [Mumia zhuanghuii]|jgi:ABC-2 type transport system ATP-binding protein|uniref:ABC transporter ATP-binding protein n=1 Tax=Mumia zhuanghuii TaxID=2585211 RepID=A0A5C4ML37_9ACTN|nr:ABC transporter ATP-binding protein [Mumia zhuanghuii]TNC40507.1 ABC transporter ATP-binding protein [Mumia zhuanghuii]TNC46294.1 ABC transporter ATP-binding protein [Mumia zhuanghuii]
MISIDSLTKTFGTVRAVDDLTFEVRPGVVTGFLGPNGSGKTTTLRMLLGLVSPTAGRATIDGREYAQIPQPARVVGAALEAASFHPGRTGLDHLRVFAPQVGVSDQRCRELLEMVGLADAAKRRVGGFSLGMRQRLALATTLLGDPPVLVLDEPANGLDPGGIRWLRELLRHFAAQGRTVLVSSHVLSEVQQTVDDVVIISRGRLVHASPLAELAAQAERHVDVVSPDAEALKAVLDAQRWSYAPASHDGTRVFRVADVAAAQVGAAAYAAGVELHALTQTEVELEDVFLRLTGQTDQPDAVQEVAA